MNTEQQYSNTQLTVMMHEHGLRPSAQRIAVLSYVANSHTHPTADEIYSELSPEYPSLSRTTIYNSLHVLVESGLIKELEIENRNCRYDFAPQPRHSHFKCNRCGRIFDIPFPESIKPIVITGCEIDDIEVYAKGICRDCKKGN